MSKTIIVSNRLPISIKKTEEGIDYHTSAGGLATGLGSIYKKGNNVWIGWPGISVPEEEISNVEKDLRADNMVPLFLNDDDIEKYYEGFSNSTIWPIFHYMSKNSDYVEDYWTKYKEVNQKFCDKILKIAAPDDIIWIHDYQLLLLPDLLRQQLPDATIGFFQHIPFPSYEIFRLIPWRSEILKGMIGADLIGFHTYDDVRHFLGSVSRILGKDSKMGELMLHDRICYSDSFPMGIDYKKFQQAAQSEETKKEVALYRASLGQRKLIISIDRLDYSKGIPQRLKAYDMFFTKHPEFIDKVSLILVVVPSRDQVQLYQELKIEIDEIVGRINGKYGNIDWSPISYFYRSFPFQTISAFYSMADVALVTPLRDGMNLVCKEYVASRINKKGVLILSEMAGAAKELSDAIIINPNDLNQMVEAINTALTMPEDEQIRRNEELQYILKRYDIDHWVEMFMKRLEYSKSKQAEFAIRKLNENVKRQLVDQFTSAEKRLIFLDYDGTLMPFNSDARKVKPDPELLQLLRKLGEDKRNKIIVISGRDKDTLEEWLGHLPIDLIAEHGVWVREEETGWVALDYIKDDWKSKILPILELFVDRTPGSSIETKNYSLVFHYRKADPELGELRSRELLDTLQYLTNNMNLHVMEGNKVLEIKNSDINKGKAAQKWLNKNFDFIMAVGDDWTDEDMFAVMPQNAYTIKVGFSTSLARFNIPACTTKNCDELRKILQNLLQNVIKDPVKVK